MTTIQLPSATEGAAAAPVRRSWTRRLAVRVRRDLVTTAAVLTVATFALVSIGPPVVGIGTFSGVDTLAYVSPHRDESMAGVRVENLNMGDTVDFALPNATFFGEELRGGEYPQWNPYVLGGVPMAATPNFAVLSPVALPFWFLPGWLAPAYLKLLELIVAVAGTYLFLRRVRLGPAAGWLGGLGFASSGYLIAWTSWPQSRVAVFIPVLFWALERLVQERRARDVVLVTLPVASMILSGFPSVTGYAVLTAGVYFLVRVLAEYRGRWRRVLGLLLAGGGGVLGGTALVAFQLLPWLYFMSHALIRGRTQGPGNHIPVEMLLTSAAPYLFGTVDPGDPPTWFHQRIFIEYAWYVGAAVLVLVLVALSAARRGRALLPGGVWLFLAGATATWIILIFLGGGPLWLMQRLPVLFSHNYVGRARSVLGLLLAVLAAVGFQILLDRWRQRRSGLAAPAPASRASRCYGIAVWLGAMSLGAALLPVALRIAYRENQRLNPDGAVRHYAMHLTTELLVGLAFGLAAAACAAWLWWGPVAPVAPGRGGGPLRRHGATVAALLIPVLACVQALTLAVPYHPRVDRDYFYPLTDAARYLQRHLGHQRFYGATGSIFGGTEVPHRIRALHGHIYLDRRFAELLEAVPGEQFGTPPTYLSGSLYGEVARHPILDRLAVSHYQTPPEWDPYGEIRLDEGDGSEVVLEPGRRYRHAFTATGGLRGIGVLPRIGLRPIEPSSRVAVTLRDAAGRIVAQADRIVRRMHPGMAFYVPLAAEQITAGAELSAEIEVSGTIAIPVAGRDGRPAVSTVTSVDDGLRLVYDDSSVIYERTTALPRARWASDVIVEPDPDRRLALLARGAVGAHQVVLDAAGARAEGEPARVRWIDDGVDEMSLEVAAEGAGYLVVADAIRTGWAVTVDGEPADLVPADHGLAAVAVGAGTHTVRLFYSEPYHGAGSWISAVTGVLLLAVVTVDLWRRRRPRRPGG